MKTGVILGLGLFMFATTIYAEISQQPSTIIGQSNMMSNTSNSLDAKTAGEAFLSANKTKPGVVTLPSGLQYKIITQGSGTPPAPSDWVVVDYSGKLINGTEFDSSYKHGQSATFQVTGVIPGWTEALQLMKPGATWELYIPSSLAYGERGAPPVIGANETLIFQVHLLEVKK